MSIKITGYTPKFTRVTTGWHSFDQALRDQTDIGFPLGQMIEIYGAEGVGKSTFVQAIAFRLAKEIQSNIAIADFEGINTKLLIANAETQGYEGEVHRIQNVKDEVILQELLEKIEDEKYHVGIVDAVGSISPVVEQKGDLGDANMGRRAFLMAQFSRRANHILINYPEKSIFLINHQYQRIGGLGVITPGGDVKGYNASIRMQVSRVRRKNKEETFPDGSYVLKGTIKKNRWGLEDTIFYLFILAGRGVHRGLTALYDGLTLDLIGRDRSITIGDKSFGYLKDIIDKAQENDEEFFQPFYDVLSDTNETKIEDTEEE